MYSESEQVPRTIRQVVGMKMGLLEQRYFNTDFVQNPKTSSAPECFVILPP